MNETAPNHSELRMALVFRADLDVMIRGKSEGQAAHAGCEITYRLMLSNPSLVEEYMSTGQAKVVLETPDLPSLEKIIAKAEGRGVPYVIITDAARTCFTEPTITCAIIGPMSKTNSNAITRGTIMRDRKEDEA